MAMCQAANHLDQPSDRDLSLLFDEPGFRLPGRLFHDMERALGADLGGLVLHDSPRSHGLCERMGAEAVTIGSHVAFAAGTYEPTSAKGRVLLAHELAHVVQKRLRASVSPFARPTGRSLEREADRTASRIGAGLAARCVLPDAPPIVRAWDRAGHYYTPYLLFLNAGADHHAAQSLALWCWMPDQVTEFDAISLMRPCWSKLPWGEEKKYGVSASDYAEGALGSQGWYMSGKAYGGAEDRDGGASVPTVHGGYDWFHGSSSYVRTVHVGIHAFTGGSAESEIGDRVNRFLEARAGAPRLIQGVALHPVGDCFAHRDGESGMLCGAYWGHSRQGSGADEVFNPTRSTLYMQYVDVLAQLAVTYTGRQPLVPLNDLKVALGGMLPRHGVINEPASSKGPDRSRLQLFEFSKASVAARNLNQNAPSVTDEDASCDYIRRVSHQVLGVRMDAYDPNEELAPWLRYFERHRGRLVPDSGGRTTADEIFTMIVRFCGLWSRMPLSERNAGQPRVRPRRVS